MTTPTDETPRTNALDAQLRLEYPTGYYPARMPDLARQLERELSASRAATIEEAQAVVRGFLVDGDVSKALCNRLRSLSASAGPGWIAVSEKPPPEDAGAALSLPVEIMGRARYHFPTDYWARLDLVITHWRPLAASPPTTDDTGI